MIFMCLASFAIMFIASLIDNEISTQFINMQDILGGNLYIEPELFTKAEPQALLDYCQADILIGSSLSSLIITFRDIVIFTAISYISSIMA